MAKQGMKRPEVTHTKPRNEQASIPEIQGSLREPWLSAVNEINNSNAQVVSVDINSGMNGDTSEAETAVQSDITVTIGYVKQGLVTENAARYIGKLVVADIGIVLAKQEHKLCPVLFPSAEYL